MHGRDALCGVDEEGGDESGVPATVSDSRNALAGARAVGGIGLPSTCACRKCSQSLHCPRQPIVVAARMRTAPRHIRGIRGRGP